MKTLLTTTALLVATSTASFAGAPNCGFFQAACDEGYSAGVTDGEASGYNNGYADGQSETFGKIASSATVTLESNSSVLIDTKVGKITTAIDISDATDAAYDAGYEAGVGESYSPAELIAQKQIAAIYQADIERIAEEKDAIIAALNVEYETLLQQHADRTEEFKIWHEVGTHYYNIFLRTADVISDHKAQAGKNYEADPVGYMTFVFDYIEDLQSQLGLN